MHSTYQYDTLGNQIRVDEPNGTYTQYTYHPYRNWLTSVINRQSDETIISAYYYNDYDDVGNRLSVSETVNSQPSTINYSYDDIYQLTSETKTGSNPYSISYSYDDAGNRASMTKTINQIPSTTNYIYNAGNQLVSLNHPLSTINYVYDNNGNLISETDGTNTTTYGWDYENRLTQITSNQFTVNNQYDALGKRIAVMENGATTKYLYDSGLPIIEKDSGDTTIATYTRGLSYGGGIGGIISSKREGTDYYYHYNGIGGVTGLTDSSSAMVATYDYDAYGNTLSATGSIPNPYGFSTKEFSNATGLAYFGARYYNPTTGRWLSQDPLGMVNGPNLYAYCGNNPVIWIDPWGFFIIGAKGWTGLILTGLGIKIGCTGVGLAIAAVGVGLTVWDVKDNWEEWSDLFENIWRKTRVDPLEDVMDDLFGPEDNSKNPSGGDESPKTDECDDGSPTNPDE